MNRLGFGLGRGLALAFLGSVAIAALAYAADTPQQSASVVIHGKNGMTMVVPVDEQKVKELLADPSAKPLSSSLMVFVANGKTYTIEDHKMPNGKMFIRSWLELYPSWNAPEGGG